MVPKRKFHKNNKDYCKRHRKKTLEKYRNNDAERKRYHRIATKALSPTLYEELKRKNRERMQYLVR